MTDTRTSGLRLSAVIGLVALPGGLAAVCYFGTAPLFLRYGLPSITALVLAMVLVLIPFELGVLLREGRKQNASFSLRNVVPWREPMPAVRFGLLVAALLAWNFAVFILSARFDRILLERLFFWLPAWALPPLNLYRPLIAESGSIAATVVPAGLILAGVVTPIVEELYFRGYLLPRMGFAGRHAPLVNAVLFSAYHLTFPWLFFSRAIAVVPVAYVAARTRNVYVGMATHVLFNVVSTWAMLRRH